MEYFVKVTGARDFYIIADGNYDFCARCTKINNDSYKFEYQYFVYVKGGEDHNKDMKTASTILKPGKEVCLSIIDTAWEYVKGCYNKAVNIYIKLISAEELYKRLKAEPNYKYGYLLLSLDKKDEFIKLLNSYNEPSTSEWSIYNGGKYELLSLAYSQGIGREQDNKQAALNAFRGRNVSLINSFIKLGYGKKTLGCPEYFQQELEGIDSKAEGYLLGKALIEEGFIEAGENRILWSSECEDTHNDYGFYNKGNEKPWYYQSLLYKAAAEILYKRGKDKSTIIEDYGKYLLYKKQGNFDNLYVTEWVNEGDEWESDWKEHIGYNKKLLEELVNVAAMSGDEFAKKITR